MQFLQLFQLSTHRTRRHFCWRIAGSGLAKGTAKRLPHHLLLLRRLLLHLQIVGTLLLLHLQGVGALFLLLCLRQGGRARVKMRLCKRITELCNVRRECRDVAGYEMTTVSVHGMQGHAGHLACFQGLAREPNLVLGSALL